MSDMNKNIMPPVIEIGVIGWLRKNLFSTWYNTILTLISLYFIYLIIPPFLSWVFFDATFSGTTREDCTSSGACWVFIKQNMKLIIYGLYPSDELWRINIAYFLLTVSIIYLLIPNLKYKGSVGIFLLFIFPVICVFLFSGGLGLQNVETRLWGGLFLTLVIAGVGIVLSLPIGIMLALGRRSKLPIVSLLAADEILAKACSNLREAAARGGQIILITEERAASEIDFADAVITVPNVDTLLAPILLAVPAQILAYLTAVEKGTDVDQPRNLAKSVTVE